MSKQNTAPAATETPDISTLRAQREFKREEYIRRGGESYPNNFQPNTTTAELSAQYADPETYSQQALIDTPTQSYKLAGRVMLFRGFGKLIFARLQDTFGQFQISLSIDASGPEVFGLFNDCIDIGDIVGVEGPVSRTNKGELTISVQNFTLLTKGLQPLPDKYHGMSDVEARYRQRYLDLITSPEVRATFIARSKAITAIRGFLDTHGFLEVETPVLQHQAGGANARPFSTHHNALDIPLNLRIAPELFLKRLLVGGFDRVYELSRNFRNEGISTKHNPEFTMLEFYAAYGTREDAMDLMEDMLRHTVRHVTGGTVIPCGETETIDFATPFRRITMRDTLLTMAGFTEADLEHVDGLAAAAKAKGVPVPNPVHSYGELFQLCFEELVEKQLIQPTYIMDYPIETSPLVRQIPGRPGWTQRAELYIAGREHGEFYSELNDPIDQRSRFERQRENAKKGNEEAMPFDHDFLNALETGMPPALGVGLGIDRLAMLLTNQPSIRDVILFPLLRQKAD